jgi:hypothetical protein
MGGVPRQWKERFGKKGEAIDESLRALLNETLGVSLLASYFRDLERLIWAGNLVCTVRSGGRVTLGSFEVGKL